MQKFDLQPLAEALYALAEALDRKPTSAKGIEVWFETLREFPTERVLGLLKGWAKTHAKFPAPAEVWKVLNDVGVEQREQTARVEKARQKREIENLPRSESGRVVLDEIAKILRTPKRTPIEHWDHARATCPVESIGHDYALAALKILRPEPEREPGQDDEERYASEVV